MKKMTLLLCVLFTGIHSIYAQTSIELEQYKSELRTVLHNFMVGLKTKDSSKLYNLFYDGPVTWVGVYKNKTQQKRLEKDSSALDYKIADYKSWFRSTTLGSVKEEKFYNVSIDTDGSVASVSFDFSFWAGGKKGLWGKESWGLVKINNEWKITSVIFSMEQENILPEPKRD